MNWAKLLERFYTDARARLRRSEHTLVIYRHALEPLFGDGGSLRNLTPETLTAREVEDAVARNSTLHRWTPVTHRKNLSPVRVFIRWLAREGLARREIADVIVLPRRPDYLPAGLAPEEVTALFDAAQSIHLRRLETAERSSHPKGMTRMVTELKHRRHAMLALLVFAGLRRGEVLRARLEDLTGARGGPRIEIRQSKGGSARAVPLDRRAAFYIAAYRQFRTDRRSPFLFCSAPKPWDTPETFRAIAPLGGDAPERDLTLLAEEAGTRKVTPNLCRHTFGTALADAGAGIHEIKALMGHRRLESAAPYLVAAAHRFSRVVEEAFEEFRTPYDAIAKALPGR